MYPWGRFVVLWAESAADTPAGDGGARSPRPSSSRNASTTDTQRDNRPGRPGAASEPLTCRAGTQLYIITIIGTHLRRSERLSLQVVDHSERMPEMPLPFEHPSVTEIDPGRDPRPTTGNYPP